MILYIVNLLIFPISDSGKFTVLKVYYTCYTFILRIYQVLNDNLNIEFNIIRTLKILYLDG